MIYLQFENYVLKFYLNIYIGLSFFLIDIFLLIFLIFGFDIIFVNFFLYKFKEKIIKRKKED